MRLFLAIDLPVGVKADLYRQLEDTRKECQDMRWVEEENLHITVQFIGQVDASKIGMLTERMASLLYDAPSFYLYSLQVDLFMRANIIIHLNFVRSKPLERLVATLQSELGVESNRRFAPHLTIARYRIPSKQQYLLIKKKFSKLALTAEFPVTQITLFESVLGGKKPMYRIVAQFPLLNELEF